MTDTHLAALARRAAADPGDLELAVALRAAQERAGVAPPVRVLTVVGLGVPFGSSLAAPADTDRVAIHAGRDFEQLACGLAVSWATATHTGKLVGAAIGWSATDWEEAYETKISAWRNGSILRCSRCVVSDFGRVAAGLAGTPRDRVLLERQAAELARRVGVGAAE